MISGKGICWLVVGREECERDLIFFLFFLDRMDRRIFSVDDHTSQRNDG